MALWAACKQVELLILHLGHDSYRNSFYQPGLWTQHSLTQCRIISSNTIHSFIQFFFHLFIFIHQYFGCIRNSVSASISRSNLVTCQPNNPSRLSIYCHAGSMENLSRVSWMTSRCAVYRNNCRDWVQTLLEYYSAQRQYNSISRVSTGPL